MILIHRYVIHELEKQARTVTTNLKLSQNIAEIDEFSELLILKLHDSFKEDSSTKHAKFESTDSNVFKKGILGYIENGYNENTFLKFASDSMKDLETDLKKQSLAAGGFFVYADYTYQNKRYIIVTLIRKTDGFDTETVNNVIRVKSIKNLNVNKLAMGFRFNLDIYTNKDTDLRHYLAIISNSKDVSEYFKKWVSADDFVTVGSENLIKLKLIGGYFFKDEYALIAYADQEVISIDHEFVYNEAILKTLIEIKVNTDGINLTIRRSKIKPTHIDLQGGLVIIHSMDLALKLSEQIGLNKTT
jgi:nucleoid-associated protein